MDQGIGSVEEMRAGSCKSRLPSETRTFGCRFVLYCHAEEERVVGVISVSQISAAIILDVSGFYVADLSVMKE